MVRSESRARDESRAEARNEVGDALNILPNRGKEGILQRAPPQERAERLAAFFEALSLSTFVTVSLARLVRAPSAVGRRQQPPEATLAVDTMAEGARTELAALNVALELQPVLDDALAATRRVASFEERLEQIGLYLLAKGEDGRLPDDLTDGDEPALSEEHIAALKTAVEAAVTSVTSSVASAGVQAQLTSIGAILCPRAGPLPSDAYLTSYPLCSAPPYVVQIDAFLHLPGPGYHFSMPRVLEAKRQSYALIAHMRQHRQCERLVLMSGNPAVGKSTWIEQIGAKEAGGAAAVFFDDLLNNGRRRAQWWEGYRAAGLADLAVEIVEIRRDSERALASNRRRGAKGGHQVPEHAMERYQREYEPPTLAEGFARVRTFENEYDDASGEGGYVLLREEAT